MLEEQQKVDGIQLEAQVTPLSAPEESYQQMLNDFKDSKWE
jgi:hypothetical protein